MLFDGIIKVRYAAALPAIIFMVALTDGLSVLALECNILDSYQPSSPRVLYLAQTCFRSFSQNIRTMGFPSLSVAHPYHQTSHRSQFILYIPVLYWTIIIITQIVII